MPPIVPFSAAVFLVGMTSFLAGMWTTYKDWTAWQWLNETRMAAVSIRDTGYVLRPLTYRDRRSDQPSEPYVVYNEEQIAPGLLLINRSANPDPGYITDLVDERGRVLHSWPIDYTQIVEDGPVDEFVHAVQPLPDGSIIVNFGENFGMARYDACGEAVWTRSDMVFHHSLIEDPDIGGFWTWTSREFDDGHDQQMTRVDADTGETLEMIDLIDDVIEPDAEAKLAMRIPEDFVWQRDAKRGEIPDIFHPNDVEPLPAEWADAFPDFNAGDLLISLRSINLVAVIDRNTRQIKWWQSGPWHQQHDPDFHADGTITVYSNKTGRDRSEIMEFDFASGEVRDKFEDAPLNFYSEKMGQHERLPNGNWLVTVPFEGRVVEVDNDGELVREIANVLDESYNSLVTTAIHVPHSYYAAIPSCSG